MSDESPDSPDSPEKSPEESPEEAENRKKEFARIIELNYELQTTASKMRNEGKERDEIKAELLEIAPEYSDKDGMKLINDFIREAFSTKRKTPYHKTDLGFAERFTDTYQDDIRFVHAWDSWVIWDGVRWYRDGSGAIRLLVHDLTKEMCKQAAEYSNPDKRTAEFAFAIKCESNKALTAMLAHAKSMNAASPEEFDRNEWLLNCPNGTIDLRTRELYKAKREDMITQLCPTEYDPTAMWPTFARFLERIIPDEEVRDFLQRAAGYSITGRVTEHCLIFAHGPKGRNGKGTLMRMIMHVLGTDIAVEGTPNLLITKKNEPHPAEIADLRGKRFVSIQETDSGGRLAEGLVKRLTGGDILKARLMGENWSQFEPTHHIWLASNHEPVISEQDWAIWSRFRKVNFGQRIPDEEIDQALPDKLKAEAKGILNWMVDGCWIWQQEKLNPPKSVIIATDDYKKRSDVLAAFLADTCTLDPWEKEDAARLFEAYKEWCKGSGERPKKKGEFTEKMAQKGFSRKVIHGSNFWVGLNIGKIDDESAETEELENG